MARVGSEFMEEILGKKFPVLDKGYVELSDYMGDWRTVAKVARTSYQGETKETTEEADARLIRRLMRDEHTSPFESLELRIKIAAPIFVFRQLVRHRTANWNEWSGRYAEMPDIMYVPDEDRIQGQHETNKQSSGKKLPTDKAGEIIALIDSANTESYSDYKQLLQEGLSRELARTVLNVNLYSTVSFEMDLHNLLRMLFLRDDEHAQYEIREYAKVIAAIVKGWCPPIYQAYLDYRKNAWKLSSIEAELLLSSLNWESVSLILSKLACHPNYTKNEYDAFVSKLMYYDYSTQTKASFVVEQACKSIWNQFNPKS